jgi:hypothetical protein
LKRGTHAPRTASTRTTVKRKVIRDACHRHGITYDHATNKCGKKFYSTPAQRAEKRAMKSIAKAGRGWKSVHRNREKQIELIHAAGRNQRVLREGVPRRDGKTYEPVRPSLRRGTRIRKKAVR